MSIGFDDTNFLDYLHLNDKTHKKVANQIFQEELDGPALSEEIDRLGEALLEALTTSTEEGAIVALIKEVNLHQDN